MTEPDKTQPESETPNPYADFTNRELAAEFLGKILPGWVRGILPLASETEDGSRYVSITIKERSGVRFRKRDEERKPLIAGRRIPIIIVGRRISYVALISMFIAFMVVGATIRSLIG